MPYDMKDAAVGPPGVIPIQQPMTVERTSVTAWRGMVRAVSHTVRQLIRAFSPSNFKPSSTVTSSSPIPNKPTTAARNDTPPTSTSVP